MEVGSRDNVASSVHLKRELLIVELPVDFSACDRTDLLTLVRSPALRIRALWVAPN